MGLINISNSKGRDALVKTQSVTIPLRVRWVDTQNQPAERQKILKATIDHDLDRIVEKAGSIENVADLLIKDDPEIDFETYGAFIKDTSKAYINPDGKVVHKVIEWEIVKTPDGTEKERRLKKLQLPNVAGETPLKWSGKMMKKKDVYNRFVFSGMAQVTHVNGLTYDFLYSMAKELEEKDSLMVLGAGAKSNQPLIFRRNSNAYRGFLEGRTQGDKYALILHLSNMELKSTNSPPKPPSV